jgi:hypothetical protein
MLAYGNPTSQNINTSSSTTRIASAMDYYHLYLEYLARTRIIDHVVENLG